MSDKHPDTVIVGAGVAGVQTAVALRERGFTGRVTLVGEEIHPPYDRPPLSKEVLLGATDATTLDVDFATLGVDLLLGHRAVELRPDPDTATPGGTLTLEPAGPAPQPAGGPGPQPAGGPGPQPAGGPGPQPAGGTAPSHPSPRTLRYERLVLATGASAVPLPGTPVDTPGLHLLRTLDDALTLRAALRPGARVVVVGAGWIGAETATVAAELGCSVTVLEAADHPLAGALPSEIGEVTRDWYAGAGVDLRTGTPVGSVEPGAVLLADGERLPADAVVIGIGARARTGWLAGSGVELAEGGAVAADDRLRASVPGVWAVGDCASFPSARYRRRLLVHHWDNALQGPATVAADLMGESVEPYDPVPYFWSEQFGRYLQYAGHHPGADRVLWRGSVREDAWTVCWLREDRLVALLAVDRPRDLVQGRRLIERGARMDERALLDATVPLKNATRRP
ncbi:NAD(P)/FAD-dependent oxidoreductase [Allostreptomyces psammosilenae]|uniref:NADPH-dependent 2,4-dienoyl-CoA reductase/sulfur reductase-like enzyme n=1 Tax=Allostreptomyces psammosilenae TaxID=1892865 RepID=A0A852ZXE4_9ACTN|nr:FAD-dependent oxidoreductase [Allostreptomyces psammosilenae]NYI07063.1 NADPH-dependent 2,4-dienoyl-CoA reductase/sulfur reductase-like enzyme [Allostreptomyces psammosilenae]